MKKLITKIYQTENPLLLGALLLVCMLAFGVAGSILGQSLAHQGSGIVLGLSLGVFAGAAIYKKSHEFVDSESSRPESS